MPVIVRAAEKNGGPKAAEMVLQQIRYSESHFQIN
jgi:hypothetical protein